MDAHAYAKGLSVFRIQGSGSLCALRVNLGEYRCRAMQLWFRIWLGHSLRKNACFHCLEDHTLGKCFQWKPHEQPRK